jgi:hypothetical protein
MSKGGHNILASGLPGMGHQVYIGNFDLGAVNPFITLPPLFQCYNIR